MPEIKQTMQSTTIDPTNPQAPPPEASPLAAAPVPAATPPTPNAALLAYVQQTVAALDTVEVGLGADPALTPALKRHVLKFRRGGDKIIGQIGNLAQQEQLDSPGLNVADMLSTLGKAQALQPLSDRVAAFAKHIDDVIFKSETDALAMGQQFYALLQRRALTDGELATAMVPVVTYFARKPKPKAPGALDEAAEEGDDEGGDDAEEERAADAAGRGSGGGAGRGAGRGRRRRGSGGGGSRGWRRWGRGSGNGAAGPAAPTGAGHA